MGLMIGFLYLKSAFRHSRHSTGCWSCCVLCNLCNVLNHAVAVQWDIWKIRCTCWFSIHINKRILPVSLTNTLFNVCFFSFWSMHNDFPRDLLNPPLSFSLPLVSIAALLRTKMCQLLKSSAPPPHSYNEVATMGTHLQLPPVTSALGIPPPAVLWSHHDQEVFRWASEHQFSARCSHGLYSVTVVFAPVSFWTNDKVWNWRLWG